MVHDELESFQHFEFDPVDFQSAPEIHVRDPTVTVPLLNQVKAPHPDEEYVLFGAPFLDFLVPVLAFGALTGNLIVNVLLVVALFVFGDQFVARCKIQSG